MLSLEFGLRDVLIGDSVRMPDIRLLVPAHVEWYPFTIYGDPRAMPYLRQTQGSKWNKKAAKYRAWKDSVRLQHKNDPNAGPIPDILTNRVYLLMYGLYHDYTHGDTDNIAKALADALFPGDDRDLRPLSDFDVRPSLQRTELHCKLLWWPEIQRPKSKRRTK